MKNLLKNAGLIAALTGCGGEEKQDPYLFGSYDQPQICGTYNETAVYNTEDAINLCIDIVEGVNGDAQEALGDYIRLSCLHADNNDSCEEASIVRSVNIVCPPEGADLEEELKILDDQVFTWGGERPTQEFCVLGPVEDIDAECASKNCDQ